MRFSKRTIFLCLTLCLALILTGLWQQQIGLIWTKIQHEVDVAADSFSGSSKAKSLGSADENMPVELVLTLKLHDEDQLDKLLAAQADPQSPLFQHYLSREEFLQRFGPQDNDIKEVTTYLEKHHLEVMQETSAGLLIHARGSVKQVQSAFDVRMKRYRNAGGIVIDSDKDPRVPAQLGSLVSSISGLQNRSDHQPQSDADEQAPTDNVPHGYGPSDIATAYNLPNYSNKTPGSKYGGKGVSIAVVSAYSYNPADVATYWNHFGINRTGTLTNVYVNGVSNRENDETTEDLELVGAQAPDADIFMYLGRDPSFRSFALIYNQIVTDNKVSVATVSWGKCEKSTGTANINTEHLLFKQAAAQGIAFFAASGDSGAYNCASQKTTPAVYYPASDSYITAVGGTTLLLNADGTRLSETAWAGSGGGLSNTLDRPEWQFGPSIPAGDKRAISDVSLVANVFSGYAMYFQGQWLQSGGTSLASPVWAALWALGNEATGSRLGPANPLVYRLGRSDRYASTFFDVQTGNNGNGNGPGYEAGPAWDYPTGWGSPNGAELVGWLVNDKTTAATG